VDWWHDASGYTIAAGAIIFATLGLVAEACSPGPLRPFAGEGRAGRDSVIRSEPIRGVFRPLRKISQGSGSSRTASRP